MMTPDVNHCGTCTMCCKLLGIHELRKPAGRWCDHCAVGQGCRVYADRPQSCQVFACGWLLATQQGLVVSPELRPDRCRVVISPSTDERVVAVHPDPGSPDAWRRSPVIEQLHRLVATGRSVVVSHGTGQIKTMLTAGALPGSVVSRKIRMSEPDENGMQHYEPASNGPPLAVRMPR